MHYATIPELGAALRNKETTPTELTKMYLERLDNTGKRLNAAATAAARAARDAGRQELDTLGLSKNAAAAATSSVRTACLRSVACSAYR